MRRNQGHHALEIFAHLDQRVDDRHQ
jgi:hypothetical protein